MADQKCAAAHPIYVSNSHVKFHLISSYGLGVDSITDRWMDGLMDELTDVLTGWTFSGSYTNGNLSLQNCMVNSRKLTSQAPF